MKRFMIISFLIILAFGLVVYFIFPDELAENLILLERESAGLTKKTCQIQDIEMTYLEGGKGQTIVLIHGYSANKDNWNQMAKLLTDHYRVVIPDLPGHGESSKLLSKSYTIRDQIQRLNAFLSKLGIKEFHLAGSSMGGTIAGGYAVQYPKQVKSLALFCSGGVRSPERSDASLALEQGDYPLEVTSLEDFDTIMSYVFHKPPFMPSFLKNYFFKMSKNNQSINNKILKDLTSEHYSLEPNLKSIKAKTLILWGGEDRILHVSSVEVFEKILDSKSVILDDCGHIPMIEKPEETVKHFLEFINTNK